MRLINAADLAALGTTTIQNVSNARRRGRIACDEDGRFDLDAPDVAQWLETRTAKARQRAETAPDENTREAESLRVFAAFLDGEERLVVEHRFTAESLELDPIHGAIPEPVRLKYGADVRVFLLDGTELPARTEATGTAFDAKRRLNA